MFGESIMQSVSDRFEDTIGLDEYLDDSADDFLDVMESAFGLSDERDLDEISITDDDIDDDDMDDDIIDGKPGGDGIMIEATMHDDDPAEFEDDEFDDIVAHPAKESLAVTDPVNTAIMDDLDIESKSYDDFFIDDDF